MDIVNALPIGSIVKLKEAEKRVAVIGICQQAVINGKTMQFDYVAVPYPEGYFGKESSILFQQSDIEGVVYMGFADIERQSMISALAESMAGSGGSGENITE